MHVLLLSVWVDHWLLSPSHRYLKYDCNPNNSFSWCTVCFYGQLKRGWWKVTSFLFVPSATSTVCVCWKADIWPLVLRISVLIMKSNPGLDTHSGSINRRWWERPSRRTNVPDVPPRVHLCQHHMVTVKCKKVTTLESPGKLVGMTNTFRCGLMCQNSNRQCLWDATHCASVSLPLGGSPQSEDYCSFTAINEFICKNCYFRFYLFD